MKKRILSMLLAIVMVLGMLPAITPTAEAAAEVNSSDLASLNPNSVAVSNTFEFVITTTDDCDASEGNCNASYVQISFEGNDKKIYLNESLMHTKGNTKEASFTSTALPCSATLYLASGISSLRTYKCEVSAYWNGNLIGKVSLSQSGGGNTYAEHFAYKESSAAFPKIGNAKIDVSDKNLTANVNGTPVTANFSIDATTNYGYDAYAGRPITVTDGSITKDNIGGRVLKNTVRTVNTSQQNFTFPGVSLSVGANPRSIKVNSSDFIANYAGTSVQFKVAAELCMVAGGYRWGNTKTVYSDTITLSKPTYTVRFNANGGSGSMNSQTLYYGNESNRAALSQNAYTRVGYTFAGWNTQSNGGGTAYADKASVLNLTTGSSITLYAQWTANEYTATLDSTKPSGATGTVTGGQGTATVTYNATPGTVTTPSLPGYTFGGYYDGANGSGTQYFNANGTGARTWNKPTGATLYAKWTQNKYNIAFSEEGGSTVSDVKATYDSNTKATVDVSTREGYTFQGWFTQQSGGKQVYDKTGRCVKGNEYWNSDGEWIYVGNVTLYAQWTPNDYTLSYNTMGGAPLEDKTVTFDSPYIGETPERIGYIFDGWYQEEGYVHEITIGATPVKTASDHSIFAKWKPITYKIYYADGTNTVKVQNATYGTEFNLPLASTLNLTVPANRHFVGWNNLSADATTVVYADGQKITTGLTTINNGTVNLYPVWAENETYRVVYDPNGGSSGPKDNNAYYEGDSVTVKFTAPTRPGYQFLGWAADADAATAAYTANGTTSFAISVDDVTLYAVWEPIQYTIKYNTGVNGLTIADQSCTYDESSTVHDVSTLNREGYTFRGWAINQGSDVVTYAPGQTILNLSNQNDATITLYAVWQPDTVSVSFDANGGRMELAGRDYAYGDTFGVLPVPTWEGHTFLGWFTELDNGTQILEGTKVDGTVTTLYAHWEVVTSMLTLPASGTGYQVLYNGSELTDAETITVNYGETVEFAVVIENGYTADRMCVVMDSVALGYQTVSGSTYTYQTPAVTKDASVQVRQVEEITFPVVLNNGTGFTVSPAKQTVKYDGSLEFTVTLENDYRLSAPTVYVDGEALTGVQNGNAYTYTVDHVTAQPVVSISATKNPQHTAIFVSDGSVYTFSTVEHESVLTAPTAPVRTGYTFGGWFTEPDCTTAYNFSDQVTEDLTLYAKWTAHTYTVSYHLNGADGTAPDNQTKTHDQTLLLHSGTPVRTGYTFLGWNTSADGSGVPYAAGSEYGSNTAATLYAQWQLNTYTVTLTTDDGVNASLSSNTVSHGDTVTITASAADGYKNLTITAVPAANAALVDGTEYTYTITGPVAFSATATAKTVYTYNFFADGKLHHTQSAVEGSDTTVILPTDPVKTGYTFLGWYVGNTQIDSNTVINSNEDVVAKWQINTYTVTPAVSGDGYTVSASGSNRVDHGGSYSFTVSIATGYNADNMKVSADGVLLMPNAISNGVYSYTVSNLTGDTAIAVSGVEKNVYTVTFYVNGAIYDLQQVVHGEIAAAPATNPVKDGATFEVWQRNGADYDFDAPVTESLSLVAKWNVNTHAVTLPGTQTGYVLTQSGNGAYAYGTVCVLTLTAAGGYSIDGAEIYINGERLLADEDGKYRFSVTEDVTVTVTGVTKKLAVTFNGNGADGGTAPTYSNVYSVGDTITLPEAGYTKTGYTFVGWNTDAAAQYGEVGDYTIEASDVQNGSITFYAIWTPSDNILYTVVHHLQNTTLEGYEVGKTEALYGRTGDNVSAEEAAFTGFTYNSSAAGTVASGVIAADGKLVLKLFYDRNTYDVTLVCNGGVINAGDVTSYVYGVGAELPANVTRTGYTFDGWYLDASCESDKQTAISADTTGAVILYAKWIKNENTAYTVKHYIEKLDGSYELKTTDNCTAPTGEIVYAEANSYPGFTYDDTVRDTLTHAAVKADGSLVLKLFYTRNSYEILFKANGGTIDGLAEKSYSFKFEDTVTVPTAVWEGHTFTGWDTDVEETMPANDLSYTAQWSLDSYTVTLPVNQTGYTLTQSGSGNYEYEDECELTLTATDGYSISGAEVYINGECLLADEDGKYRFTVTEDVTVTVTGVTKKLAVTFSGNGSNGGTAPTDSNVYSVGDTITLPAAGFTKTGYTFVGWNTDSSAAYGETGDYTIEASDVKSGSITFYAIWVKSDNTGYKVEHYLQNTDGSWPTTADVTEDLYGTTGEYVEATAKTFVGFTYDSTVAGTLAGGSIAENGSLTLKLYYTRNSYTVSFVPNEGKVSGELKRYVYGVGAELPGATRTGYTFGGWFETPDLGGTAVTEITVNDTGDKLYYAKWTENTNTTYTVEHHQKNLYGGYTKVKADTQTLTGTTGSYTEAIAKTYTGFTAQPIEQVKIDADGSTKIVIKYDRNSYQLVFDANGGEGGTSEQMLYETPIVAPVVTREDWTFTGWTPAVAATMPAANTTYTASWTQDTYTITYDANGGSGSAEQTPYVSVLPTLHNGEGFARDGWTLVGWSTAPGENNAVDYALGQTLDTAPVEKGQTFCLYAVWVQNMVTVTFDPNGGVVSPEAMVYAENSTYQNMPIPERDDYTFVGWFTEADGGNQIVNGATLIADAPHSLYAHWATDTYSIVYHANGGNEADKTVRYELNGTPTLEGEIFTRANYDHVGWSAAENGTIDYELSAVLEADLAAKGETIHLYAVWGIADVVVQGYTGVYDGEDHAISYSLANQITVTDYQWYFKPTGSSVYVPVEDTDDDPCTYPVRDVAESGTYYCHIDGLEDDYYVVSFNTEEATVAISRRPISVTANNGEKVYDGLPLTEGGCTFTPNGTDMGICIAHTTEVTMTEESSITNVGQTPNVLDMVKIFDAEGKDVTENYTITKLPGTLKVTPRDVALTPVEETLNVLYGTEVSDVNALLLSRYTVSSATPLGYGDEMGDLSINFEYSVDGENFAPLTDAALRELYRNNTETFIIRPIVNSGNYNHIDAEHAEITATVVKTTLWAKVKWYGGNNYTNRLSLTFYNASYDNAAQAWVVDESKPVHLPNGEMPEYEIRNYKTGEVLCSGVMTKIGNRYWASFDPIRVQAQVFFTADGYVIRSY